MATGVTFTIGSSAPPVHAADPATAALANAMDTLSSVVAAGTSLKQAAEAVPFTGVAPALQSGLDMVASLQATLGQLKNNINNFEDQAPGAVGDALEGLDTTTAGGVKVVVGCDGSCDAGESQVSVSDVAGVVSITLPVALSKTIASTPLAFDDVGHVLTLSGGALDVSLTASATLNLTFDTNTYTANAAEAFHVAPFVLSFTAGLTATSIEAATTLGIAKATATLKGLAVSAGISVSFKDPDAVGGITLGELQNTTASDLVAVDRAGSVAGKLDLDTSLIPGSPDVANIDIGDPDLGDGFSFTLPALTDFNPFTFTSPEALVAMLGQAAIALGGGQTSTDPALPFLNGTLRRLAQASRPVLDVVDSIGVICGATNQQPPAGSVQNLKTGDKAYCQAIVTTGVKPGSVSWTSNNSTAGVNASGANADGTAALSPSKNAEFTMTADGAIDAHVAYTATFDDDNNGTVDREVPGRTGQRPPRNVQDLAAIVQSIGGFDSLSDLLSYDPGTKALSFHLKKTFDGAEINLPLSVGDQLESGTGVVGLSTTGGGITAKATGIKLDLTAGVLLLPQNEWGTVSGPGGCPDPANPNPCTSPLDLFFLKINPNAPEFSIGDAAFTLDSPTLRGQLGFLGVTAGVTNFGLTRSDSTKPVLTVDLTKAGDMTVNNVVLPDAVRLRELLFHIQDHVTISPLNLKLGGELKIDGTLNNVPVASATVGVNWDLLQAGAPTITPSTDFAGLFANFNPVPNLFGQATGTDSTTVLTASAASFTDSAIGVQLHNVTDGSSCAVLSRTPTTLTCKDPLAGGADNTWQNGDFFRLEIGSPLALLGLLLDNLDQITNTIKNLTGVDAAGALDTELPIVGISPRQLLSQIDELRQTINELRGDGSVVHCSLQPGAQVDPSQVVLDAQGKGTLYCNVTSLKPATAATWSATLLGLPGVTVTVDQPANPANSGGPNPTDQAVVHLTGTPGATIRQRHEEAVGNTTTDVGYQVHVTFTDVDGDHTEEYPSLAQPGTIQALEKAIKEKLGITQGFTLSLDDAPGGGKMISIDVNVGRCNDASLCDPADVNMDPLSTTINADVSGLGGLVSAGSGGEIAVKYTAGARLKLGVTLDNGVPKVFVLPGTGVAVKGRFQATGLSFNADLGPFSVVAGTNARLNDQGTPETGDDVFDGNGVVKLGADLTIGQAITSPVAIGDFVSNLGTYLTPNFTAGPDQDCGSVTTSTGADPMDPGDDTVVALSGAGVLGCGLLSIGIAAGNVTNYVADLGIKVELVNGQFTVTPAIPDDLLAKFAAAALDLRLILASLPKLIGQVKDAMRASGAAAAGNGKLPLIGDALDAGADVAQKLQDITQTLSDEIGNYVGGLTDPDAGLKSALQNLVFDKVGPSGLLMKPDGSAAATAATDIEVITDCGGSCAGKSMTDLKDVRVIFGIGQSLVDTNVPFDLGLDGVPLRLVGSVHPSVTWSYVVDLGLNRTTGPYIGVKKPTGSSRPDSELNLTANIGLGDNDAACNAVLPDPLTPLSNDPSGNSIIPGAWSEHRCLAGQLSFLGVQIRDGDGTDATKDQASAVSLHVGLDLKNGNNDTLGLTNIDGVSLTPTVGLDTRLNLRFRTGIAGGQSSGFPEVVGTFHLGWAWDINQGASTPTVGFDNIYLNLEPLLKQFIEPISEEVRKITGPFKPIIDTLTAPIPVVSDLAALVGQPPVTLLGLMEVISGNDLSLIQSLAGFISFINDPKVAQGYIPLGGLAAGSFKVDPAGARTAQSPADAGKLVKQAVASASSLFGATPTTETGGTTNSNLGTKATNTTPVPTKAKLPGTFGVPGLTFPFMDNPSQIFNLLMGQDITLVRYDVGPLQATAGFSYNFPPILIGPVPVAIGVGGSVTVKGRFVIGYDTSGLRKVLAGGSGVYLFDGIFLDDLDANGVDVPEVSFIGEVYAQAGVTIGIASAGIVAGLRITVDLNLDDSPNPDGKLHIEEIVNKLQNPICLFDVKGKLEAFIKAFVELELFITSIRFEFTLLELTLLEFSGKCTPPAPKLAELKSNGELWLNVGDRANLRNLDPDNKDEAMTVRPVGGGTYSVTGFGLTQTFGPTGQFKGPSVAKVVADGKAGNDKFLMLAGGDESQAPLQGATTPTTPSIPFTAQTDLKGGDDNDVIQGGDAGDTIDGGKGDDRIDGGLGNDTLIGNDGVDTINGGPGNDNIDGGNESDTLNGQAGDDRVVGGPGDDLLQGGPGNDSGGSDGVDTLIGGPGIDSIDGGNQGDFLYGDAEVNVSSDAICAGDVGNEPNDQTSADKLTGGDGNDLLVGGAGPDEMYGGAGNDHLCGNQGNDLMDGDQGTDAKVVPGDDYVSGGSGSDKATGNGGNDYVLGGPDRDEVDGGAGNDDVSGGGGSDHVLGGTGNDVLVGDDATVDQNVDKATRTGVGAETLVSNVGTGSGGTPTCGFVDAADLTAADCLEGGDGHDLIYGEGGNDEVHAGEGNDRVRAGEGDDVPVRGDGGDDTMFGEAGNDTMYGDSGNDFIYGNAGIDTIRGGIGDDYVEGNEGIDTLFGEGQQDDLIGGTSVAATPDDGDTIDGGASADVVVGDNGTITRSGGNDAEDPTSVARDVTIFDVGTATGGGDTIIGGLDNDQVWGGNGGDTITGNAGRDRLEGNDGSDTINGNDDADLIVGGSSARAKLFAADGLTEVSSDAAPDIGDTLHGDAGNDVIAGDDATLAFDGVATMTGTDVSTNFGNDTISGDQGQDRAYGQLGDDTISGNDGEDYLIGDLGAITPGTPTGTWPGGAPQYEVRLTITPDNGGVDTIDGGPADDHLFGGASNDVISGQSGDDYMEGNGGQDSMYGYGAGVDTLQLGERDQDDMIGGTSNWTRPGEDVARVDVGEMVMEGGPDHDVMTGDNARIDRITAGNAWAPDEVIAGARKRTVTLLDRERPDLTLVSGGDYMLGNSGSDRMYGEGGDDTVKGNTNDDLLEGNQGNDWLEGNDGEDDVIGGSSALASAGGIPLADAGTDLGDPDGTDAVFGGSGADVLAGDNAAIIRQTAGNTTAYEAAMATAYFTTDPGDNVPGWWIGVTTNRLVQLRDRAAVDAGRFGADLIDGGSSEDIAFGQDGNDWVGGGSNDDAVEGNGGADTLVGDNAPALDGNNGEPVVSGPIVASTDVARDGAAAADGEDDIVGGSNVSHRDGGDSVAGNGEDDFVLGDNGTLQRNIASGAYVNYSGDGAHLRIMRRATRLDVEALAADGVWGGDTLRGNAGDDAIWGQDGNDTVYGGAGDDDLFGEIGDDTMYGGTGEDAMIGDRGGVLDTTLGDAGASFAAPLYQFNSNGPPFVSYTGFRPGTYDRRVDLTMEVAGSVGGPFTGGAVTLTSNGLNAGGHDTMRGGPEHDSMHGAVGDDVMNGDTGGDILFGDDGADVMWGGRGSTNQATPDDRGTNESLVDYLFGGHGGTDNGTEGIVTGGADVIDYLPRPGVDPQEWQDAVAAYDDGESGGETLRQFHQGVDWVYGGWDRDVMEANLADNGPNPGDRLFDWTGAYNLYVHCNAAYGGYNDQRTFSPQMKSFLENVAFSLGVGASLPAVQSATSSAYRELALVYNPDVKSNTGSAYPTTPGHFDQPAACVND